MAALSATDSPKWAAGPGGRWPGTKIGTLSREDSTRRARLVYQPARTAGRFLRPANRSCSRLPSSPRKSAGLKMYPSSDVDM